MRAQRDAGGREFTLLIEAIRRRMAVRDLLLSVAAGLLTASAIRMLLGALVPAASAPAAVTAGTLAAALLFRRRARDRTRAAAVRTAEDVHPASRNLLVTAEELQRHPERASPLMRERVWAAADKMGRQLGAADVTPLRQMILGGAAFLLGMLVFIAAWHPRASRDVYTQVTSEIAGVVGASGRLSIEVTMTPPAYSGQPAVRLRDPDRIDALEGSELQFTTSQPSSIRFGERRLEGDRQAHVLSTSGYFVIEAQDGERRLISVSAIPDRAPAVRIEHPGKDLFMTAGDRTLPISAVASDDLGLRSLEVRYTKVTGSGEQFEFDEGSLPVRIEKASAREWTARAQLPLGALKLSPGDSLVYRAVSRDTRPGDAGLASSDTYVIEILGPGQAAVDGIEMPPGLERYGMSQQMIVVKLERIRAEEKRLSQEGLVEQLASLAAEQRTVRANFIFLLGGHVEDEEEEAEHSHEIQEGRLENTARRDINVGIGHMTRAEQGMAAGDTAGALTAARQAVDALQRAFGRNRYLLRSLAVRSRLDVSRRLTGNTEGTSDWRRLPVEPRAEDAGRSILDDVLAAGREWTASGTPADREIAALAERLIAMDPRTPVWSGAARRLLEARDAGSAEDLRRVISDVARLIRHEVDRESLPRADVPSSPRIVRVYREEQRR